MQEALRACVEAGRLTVIQKAIAAWSASSTAGGRSVSKHLARQCLLHATAAFGRVELLKHLLAVAPSLAHERDRCGSTAIHAAADAGSAGCIEPLIAAGGDVNATDMLQRTPLHIAVAAGRVAAVLALLHAGADIAAVDDRGRTPGMLCAQSEELIMMRGCDAAAMKEIEELLRKELAAARRMATGAMAKVRSGHTPTAAQAAAMAAMRSTRVVTSTSARVFDFGGDTEGKDDGHAHHSEGKVGDRPPLSARRQSSGCTSGRQSSSVSSTSATASDHQAYRDAGLPIELQLDRYAARVAAKVQACIAAGLVSEASQVYAVLDSGGDGTCTLGDILSGFQEMGIQPPPHLVVKIAQRLADDDHREAVEDASKGETGIDEACPVPLDRFLMMVKPNPRILMSPSAGALGAGGGGHGRLPSALPV